MDLAASRVVDAAKHQVSKAQEGVDRLRLRRAPLLAACVWFALGIVAARVWHPAILILPALGLFLGLTLLALRQGPRVAVVPLAAVWMLAGAWCAQIQPAPASAEPLLRYADGLSRSVRGHVLLVRQLPPRVAPAEEVADAPWEQEAEQPEAMSLDLQVDSIEEVTPDLSTMVPVSGGVRATVILAGATAPDLHCGDVVQAPMRLKTPERYRDPGAWQYADLLLKQGIGAHANLHADRLVKISEGSAGWHCRVVGAQAWAAGCMMTFERSQANHALPHLLRLTADDAGMLNAMLFGDRSRLNHALRLGFERTGSFHLFVVSGMHVALLAGAVFWVLRRLRLPPWLVTLLTISLTAAYAILTGFGAPVQRALWMTAIFLLAKLISRDGTSLNALGAAALVVLVLSPNSLFDSSFQMTFLAVTAIAGIAGPLGEITFLPYARAAKRLDDTWLDLTMQPRLAQFRVMLRLWSDLVGRVFGQWTHSLPALLLRGSLWGLELVLVGVVAEMVMVLPMATYFHRATVFALPANSISVPLVAVLAPMGVLTFAASLISPWLAMFPAALTATLLHGVTGIIGRVSQLRAADLRVPAPAWWVAILAVLAWAFCCWAVRRSRRWALAAVVLLPLVAAMVLWPEAPVVHPGELEVTAIDVGQGDSLLVVGPDGRTVLVDAGGPVGIAERTGVATSGFDVGEEVVSQYLWSRRFRRLDAIALTHAHSDHMGGMVAVMRNFHPRELWVGIDPQSDTYAALLAEAAELDVNVRHFHAGEQFGWGALQVQVLAPFPGYTNAGSPRNDDSLVTLLHYEKATVLMEGDAESPSEQAMLAAGQLRPVTLLKVGHHGSRTSTTQPFLDALTPVDAVMSVGKGNTFGHPRGEVITRLAAAHARIYRTDEFGLTTFLLSRDGRIREVVGSSN